MSGAPVKLPRFYLGDKPAEGPYQKRRQGGLQWLRGFLDPSQIRKRGPQSKPSDGQDPSSPQAPPNPGEKQKPAADAPKETAVTRARMPAAAKPTKGQQGGRDAKKPGLKQQADSMAAMEKKLATARAASKKLRAQLASTAKELDDRNLLVSAYRDRSRDVTRTRDMLQGQVEGLCVGVARLEDRITVALESLHDRTTYRSTQECLEQIGHELQAAKMIAWRLIGRAMNGHPAGAGISCAGVAARSSRTSRATRGYRAASYRRA